MRTRFITSHWRSPARWERTSVRREHHARRCVGYPPLGRLAHPPPKPAAAWTCASKYDVGWGGQVQHATYSIWSRAARRTPRLLRSLQRGSSRRRRPTLRSPAWAATRARSASGRRRVGLSQEPGGERAMTSDTSSTVCSGPRRVLRPVGPIHPDPTATSDESRTTVWRYRTGLKEPIPVVGLRWFTPASGRLRVSRLTTVSVPPDVVHAPGI